MATALKRETVYAVGEVMRNHSGRDNAKLVIAPDELHACKLCYKCDRDVGACDDFHDKLVKPIDKRVCKYWELHTHRIDKVPPKVYPELVRELHLADQVGEVSACASDLVQNLGRMLRIIDDLPPSLKQGMPVVAWMEELKHAVNPDHFHSLLIFFDNLAAKLRKTLPEETPWDKLLNQLTAPHQSGGPKEDE